MMINVTKPFLPPIDEYHAHVEEIWKREWLTNHGPLAGQLEHALQDYLQIPHLLLVTNGTIALQLAIKALGLRGEIITTPFSYVATTSAIVWESCTPVMVDISASSLNIDPNKIEAAITPHTSAILATHVFGNMCNVSEIEIIAKRHGLKVIYDAAQAFGTKYQDRSAFAYGDIATASFHATKPFHTVEGGAVICRIATLSKRISRMRNFGHISPTDFRDIGINGKNSEVHAAMGLCNLKYIDRILASRRTLSDHYKICLAGLPVSFQRILAETQYNHAYFPVIFENERTVLKVIQILNQNNINPRRYFYPSLSELHYVQQSEKTPISNSISRRILCLPLFFGLDHKTIESICALIRLTVEELQPT